MLPCKFSSILSPCTATRWWKPSTALQLHKGRKPTPGPHCTDQPYKQGTPRSWKSNHLPRLSRPALLDCLPRFLRPHAGKFPVHRLCKSDHQGGCSSLGHIGGTLPSWLLNNDQRGSLCNCRRCYFPSWSVFSLRSMHRTVSLQHRTRYPPRTPRTSSWRHRLDTCLLCMACSDRCWFLQPRGLRVCPPGTHCTVTRR